MEEQFDLNYYWNAFIRRKWYFIIPFVVLFSISSAIALFLSPVYRSSATILIEAQEIPQELVQTTVTGYFEQRLQSITQLVLSRKNLLEIIDQYNPYPQMMQSSTSEELIEKMRKDFKLEPILADVVHPQSGREAVATIAFSLSYEGENPGTVVKVLNRLVSLYLEENLKQRQEKATTTYSFLEEQLKQLEIEIADIEEKIARYKEKHLESLPELVELNLSTLQRIQREQDEIQQRIVTLEDRRVYLQGQLATMEHERFIKTMDDEVAIPLEIRLADLRKEQSDLLESMPSDDPKLLKVNEKIAAHEASIGSEQRLLDTNRELAKRRAELAEANEKYTVKHPDVMKLTREVKALEEEVLKLSKQMEGAPSRLVPQVKEIENPAYINIRTQIKSTELEIQSARQTMANLEQKEQDYQTRLETSPQVEQAYKSLQRDYAVAQVKYNDTLARLQAAREAKGLEEGRIAEKLTVIEPPITPEKPIKPNRFAVILVGFVLAVSGGLGLAAFVEFMDDSLHTPDVLRILTDQPVLGVIPYLQTKHEKRAKRRNNILAFSGIVVGVAALLVSVHLFYEPLDMLWLKVLNKFN